MEPAVTTVADPEATRSSQPLPSEVERAAQARIDGCADEQQILLLQSDEKAWVAALYRLLDRAEQTLASARTSVGGPARAMVLHDLDEECFRIDAAITALIGEPAHNEIDLSTAAEPTETARHETALQISRRDGRIVAWAKGPGRRRTHEELLEQISALGGGAIEWDEQASMKAPGCGRVSLVSAPLSAALGWLMSLAGIDDERAGVSMAWMGQAAALAVESVAQGRVVPQLSQAKRRRKDKGEPNQAGYRITWTPALIEAERFDSLLRSLPAAAMVGSREQIPDRFVMAALTDIANTVVGIAAGQLETPAAPPTISTRSDVAEAALCHLDGEMFNAPTKLGADLVRKLSIWGQPVLGIAGPRLVVRLDKPDEAGAWHVEVLARNDDGGLNPVEVAMVSTSKSRAKHTAAQLARLERLFPEMLRLGGRRRGEVILSQDEAWNLMTTAGDTLRRCGFEVLVPEIKRSKAVASLRLTSAADQSTVGANQLADVRWSALFDGVELSAADIAKLAAEARPLLKSRGRWVEVDKADLAEAAAALAERADMTRLSGADMLRQALGLEGSQLAGGVNLAGDGWAADLLRSVEALGDAPAVSPEGFVGELRTYQADAVAWLRFLDDAGLGGCLALDMGLGKTPITLAEIAGSHGQGPALVVAPPAVVSNWAAESQRFVPGVKFLVHHGARRSRNGDLADAFDGADLVITTYGTALRDMDQLCEIEWAKIVIDEAQAIKNPAAETSQQLRRLKGRTRLALTGTPIENGLGDLWSILDWANPGLLGPRSQFMAQLSPGSANGSSNGSGNGSPGSPPGGEAGAPGNGGRSRARGASRERSGEAALRALNGILVYRRTKNEPAIADELPDRIDELDHCAMTAEQIGLYQAVLDNLIATTSASEPGTPERKGAVLAAITALKQICNHPLNYRPDDGEVEGRSGKLARLNEIIETVFDADEKVLIFTHFATWGERLADYLSERTGQSIECYHGGLARGARDRMVDAFQFADGKGALVLSLKAGGTGLNLTAANHVVLFDRWWNPAVEDQARDRAWRIGQTKTVICHRLVCPGTVDERVEEVVAGKRRIADLTLPRSSSIGDLDAAQLQQAFGIDPSALLDAEPPIAVAAASGPSEPASEPAR